MEAPSDRSRLIRELKKVRREGRRIKFIGYMRRVGRRARYVRVG